MIRRACYILPILSLVLSLAICSCKTQKESAENYYEKEVVADTTSVSKTHIEATTTEVDTTRTDNDIVIVEEVVYDTTTNTISKVNRTITMRNTTQKGYSKVQTGTSSKVDSVSTTNIDTTQSFNTHEQFSQKASTFPLWLLWVLLGVLLIKPISRLVKWIGKKI